MASLLEEAQQAFTHQITADWYGWPVQIRERAVAQVVECPPVKVSIILLILLSGPICSLRYFPFQPVVLNWSIKGCGMCCSVCGKGIKKTPCCLSEKVVYVPTVGFLYKEMSE